MAADFLIFGHRGSPKRFPENTIESFEEAFRAGADGFETDLRLLSDRVPILFHDDDLGDDAIESLSVAQCSERGVPIVRVADLEPFTARGTLILEVKRSRWEGLLAQTVRNWPNIVLASFDHTLLASVRKRDPNVALGITIYGAIANVAGYAAGLGATWCFPNYHYVDAETVASLHERGVKVVPWTANRVREWESLRGMGCDGVITDLPGEAVAWRASSFNR
jgi:glycerophosphoryl diester phosphodiesterase